MDLWMKIAWAAALIMMLVLLFPRAKEWMEQGPKAQSGDWQAAILPLALVMGFVILLLLV
jgi:hypothetical protein